MKLGDKTTIQKIIQKNIKIKNKKNILRYINDFGYYRLIECYAPVLKKIANKIVNTNQVINFFNFDQKLSNLLIYYIFEFEQKFNNIAMDEIFKFNNLPNDYVLKIINNPANSNLKNKGYLDFVNDVYDNVKSCNLIDKYYYHDIKEIPLKVLSLSWSFHTIISFVNLQDDEVLRNISKRFNIDPQLSKMFISLCHSIRKFRNTLSHNGMCISTNLTYYCREFNSIYNSIFDTNVPIDSNIDIKKIIRILQYLLDIKNLKQSLKKMCNKFKMCKKVLNKVVD